MHAVFGCTFLSLADAPSGLLLHRDLHFPRSHVAIVMLLMLLPVRRLLAMPTPPNVAGVDGAAGPAAVARAAPSEATADSVASTTLQQLRDAAPLLLVLLPHLVTCLGWIAMGAIRPHRAAYLRLVRAACVLRVLCHAAAAALVGCFGFGFGLGLGGDGGGGGVSMQQLGGGVFVCDVLLLGINLVRAFAFAIQPLGSCVTRLHAPPSKCPLARAPQGGALPSSNKCAPGCARPATGYGPRVSSSPRRAAPAAAGSPVVRAGAGARGESAGACVPASCVVVGAESRREPAQPLAAARPVRCSPARPDGGRLQAVKAVAGTDCSWRKGDQQ